LAKIKAQKIPRKSVNVEDILALFCYKYPQYKYSEARNLPYRRLVKMLKIAQKEDAKFLYTLTRAIISPHTKGGSGARKLIKELEGIING
jgi:ribosomal protein L35AE/L33A